ncbi:sialidase family protein [Mariniphaga sediminis]|uniref:sialidase family protein n=1 Tax=Mariniphaga sediminis TaxID=1628158 RepID=UPI00356414A3
MAILLVGCQTTKKEVAEQPVNWERLGPGGGGSTFIPTFSYHSPDNFMVRCDMTGSYLTKNGGASYQQINVPNGATAYAFDPKDANKIYIGSNVLKYSADGGKNWEQIFPSKEDVIREEYIGDHANYQVKTNEKSLYGAEFKRIKTICVDPEIAGAIYFSMGSFFYYSSNAGKSWHKKDLNQQIDFIYTNKTGLKNGVYIFTSHSICIFDKSSNTFIEKKLPKEMTPAFSFAAGIEQSSGKEIFYALHHNQNKPIQGEFGYTEVWFSNDFGIPWNRLTDSIVTNDKSGLMPSYSMISCAEFDARHAYLVCNRYQEKKEDGTMAYWYGVLKTNDTGKTWEWVWKGGGGSGQYGVKDGIGISNLKDAWVENAFGGEYIRLLDVGVAPYDGQTAIVTDWYRTMKTTDGGQNWAEIYSEKQPDGTFISRGMDVTTSFGVHFDPFDSSHVAISYTDIGYHHSFNGGKSWSRSVEGVPVEWSNTCYWVVFDPDIKDKVWSGWSGMHDFPRGKMTRNPHWKELAKGGVCLSLDGGKTWRPVNEGMGFDSPVTSMVLDQGSAPNNRTIYAAVYNKGVYKSVDDGKSWKLKNTGIDGSTCAFELTMAADGSLFLTVSPTPKHTDGVKGRGYYSGAIYKSTNKAESWKKLDVTGDPIFPNGVACDPQNPKRIYLGCWADIQLSDLVGGDIAEETGGNEAINMQGGVFVSEDGGETWTSLFDKNQYVYDVTTDPYHPGRIYCCTFNNAAWRSDNYGKSWEKIKDYDFHWGHRIIVDQNEPEKIYITTFGSSVWHGIPETEW